MRFRESRLFLHTMSLFSEGLKGPPRAREPRPATEEQKSVPCPVDNEQPSQALSAGIATAARRAPAATRSSPPLQTGSTEPRSPGSTRGPCPSGLRSRSTALVLPPAPRMVRSCRSTTHLVSRECPAGPNSRSAPRRTHLVHVGAPTDPAAESGPTRRSLSSPVVSGSSLFVFSSLVRSAVLGSRRRAKGRVQPVFWLVTRRLSSQCPLSCHFVRQSSVLAREPTHHIARERPRVKLYFSNRISFNTHSDFPDTPFDKQLLSPIIERL
jgi:hypothetical protein